MALCELSTWPTNPLRGSCVSERSRCANFLRRRRTLCGDRACRSALAVAPCEFSTSPPHPLRGSCVSLGVAVAPCESCTLADEPSEGIVRVGSLSLWRRANWLMNPVRGSCVSDPSRCNAVRVCTLADELSARSCVSDRFRCGFRYN